MCCAVLADFAGDALTAHNQARAKYGANALTYDNNLASGAASYAAQCHWGHSRSGLFLLISAWGPNCPSQWKLR